MTGMLKKPDWLTIKLQTKDQFKHVKETLRASGVATVCEESHCPNIPECWSGGTATFMILGDTCTRACKFCYVKTGFPGKPVDPQEIDRLVDAVSKWKLEYIVVTSVDRDDLPDQGSSHFAECIRRLKETGILVEVLIPDFRGNEKCLDRIIAAKPDVIAHNIEVVERLQSDFKTTIRDPRANFKQSLGVLEYIKKKDPNIFTKSSIMVGFGEKNDEVIDAMKELRKIDVNVLMIGQYLRPSEKQAEVKEYVSPEIFKYYKDQAKELGFLYCAAGPFVRTSYRAGELFMKNILKRRKD